jgi:alpha-galactosidase
MELREPPRHWIEWQQVPLKPIVLLKKGILRKGVPLERLGTSTRAELEFSSGELVLSGRWEEIDSSMSRLTFTLANVSSSPVQIARLRFPAENGLADYLDHADVRDISFLRNGYQSWSTARSYRPREKPLRPWLQIVSLASSNLANLPSNVPGLFSSELYAVISDRSTDESFLVGQAYPFNQFFYITLHLFKSGIRTSYFELTFDLGRKLLTPGERIELDGIIMARGRTHDVQDRYFERIRNEMGLYPRRTVRRGWSSWYYYYNRITPEIILENLRRISDRKVDLDFVQIDDGFQTAVGDWLSLRPAFQGRMRELSDAIREAGYLPGIWIAPFVAERGSQLLETYPEFALKNDYGRKLEAGIGPFWKGRYYYGLDITHPLFEDYLRTVIRTIVHDWGYRLLKCDFLFGGCLRGGNHIDIRCSRAEVLKRGMRIIREEAGDDVVIIGCGMPLSPGIGTVDAMRIGPDTGPFWIHRAAKWFRTGSMVGVRNSVRNTLVRSPMHERLWQNDPDCVMVRETNTKLTAHERQFQIDAGILSGGLLTYSDDFSLLPERIIREIAEINRLNDECARGRLYAVDLMERETPELAYNTAGYLGVFNFKMRPAAKKVDLSQLFSLPRSAFPSAPAESPGGLPFRFDPAEIALTDARTGAPVPIGPDGTLDLGRMPARSSRLFRLTVGRP